MKEYQSWSRIFYEFSEEEKVTNQFAFMVVVDTIKGLYSCTGVQVFSCTVVQLCSCTGVQL